MTTGMMGIVQSPTLEHGGTMDVTQGIGWKHHESPKCTIIPQGPTLRWLTSHF